MAIYSNTLAQLIEWTLKIVLHDWKGGTATAGDTDYVTDTARYEDDDYFQNTTPISKVYIISTTDTAAPQGEQRLASDFDSNKITVGTAFSAAVGVGDTYCVTTDWEWDEIKDAINLAIESVAEEALFFVTDETTITLAAATYEYAMPTSFMYLYRVAMADASDDYPDPIPPDQYKVVKSATPYLHLYRFPTEMQLTGHSYEELWVDNNLTADRVLRLEGLSTPDKLSANTDTCPINPNYLIYQAGALLHLGRISQPTDTYDYHRVQMEACQKRADIERGKVVSVALPPDSKRCRE